MMDSFELILIDECKSIDELYEKESFMPTI